MHPREERPIALQTAPAENYGAYSSPVFNADGTLIATYDSGSNLVHILRSSDLTPIDSLTPARRPRRLSFSPSGRFLVIEDHPGWIDDFLNRKASSAHIDIDSPEAIKDNIQRVEVWNLRTRQTIPDLSCDAVTIKKPEGGWLWAKQWAISSGNRSSALLEAHFSANEATLSALCWNGVQQQWDSLTWKRIEDIPPPPFWKAIMGNTPAKWLAESDPVSRSSDGRIVLFQPREKDFGFGTIYLWNRNSGLSQKLPGECASRLLPVYSLSHDGQRFVVACNKGLGYAIRAWSFDSGQELPLKDADLSYVGGMPTITSGGVALSPDGRYLAVALLKQMEYLLPNVLLVPAGIFRSDLRLWNVDEGKELVSVPIDDLVGTTGYFGGIDLAFSPDSKTLVVAGRQMRIYRLTDLCSSRR